jgi:hypothetical protein
MCLSINIVSVVPLSLIIAVSVHKIHAVSVVMDTIQTEDNVLPVPQSLRIVLYVMALRIV